MYVAGVKAAQTSQSGAAAAELKYWAENVEQFTVYSDRLAVFDRLVLDLEGNLYVSDYRPEGTVPYDAVPFAKPAQWRVFGPDGFWLGTLTLPPELNLVEVGRDYVLTVSRDDNGFERVRMYRLHRPIDR